MLSKYRESLSNDTHNGRRPGGLLGLIATMEGPPSQDKKISLRKLVINSTHNMSHMSIINERHLEASNYNMKTNGKVKNMSLP